MPAALVEAYTVPIAHAGITKLTIERSVSMDSESPPYYQITIKAHLDAHWSNWFEGMTITNQPGGEAVLVGPIVDQAALHGLLAKIRDFGLPLIAVQPILPDTAQRQ
jgi:hypothetical protein